MERLSHPRLKLRSHAALLVLAALVAFARPTIGNAQSAPAGCVALTPVTAYGGGAQAVAARASFAYLGEATGLAVIDLRVPAEPARLAYLPLGGVLTGYPQLVGNLLYGVVSAPSRARPLSLAIVDISDPARPALLSSTAFAASYTLFGLAVANGFAYLGLDIVDAQGSVLQIVDARDPARPTVHRSLVVPSLTLPGGWTPQGHSVAVIGSTVLLGTPDGVVPVDVRNPDSPVVGASITVGGAAVTLWAEGARLYAETSSLLGPAQPLAGRPPAAGLGDLPEYNYRVELKTFAADGPRLRMLGSFVIAPNARAPFFQPMVSEGRMFVAGLIIGAWTIADLSDPNAPQPLGLIQATGRAMASADQRVYFLNNSQALSVVDISAPATPSLISIYSVDALLRVDPANPSRVQQVVLPPPPPQAHQRIKVLGDRAYRVLIDLLGPNDQLQIFDVTTPAAPRLLGQVVVAGAREIYAVTAGVAYIASAAGVSLVDVRDPGRPAVLSALSDVPNESAVSAVASDAGRAFLLSKERVRWFDLAQPAQPTPIGDVPLETLLLDDRMPSPALAVVSDTLLLSDGSYGLALFDLGDPTRPAPLARLSVPFGGTDTAYVTQILPGGASVYLAYRSGTESGLLVVDISRPSAPRVIGAYRSAIQDLSDKPIEIVAMGGGYIAFNNGGRGMEILAVRTQAPQAVIASPAPAAESPYRALLPFVENACPVAALTV